MTTNSSSPDRTGGVSRRGLLAGSAALAGAGLLAQGGAVAGATARSARHRSGPRQARPPVPPPLVLEGGTLLDPLTGEVTEDATVVLARGKVVAAGPSAEARSARAAVGGAQTIDVGGAWLLPGLLDAHTHATSVESAARALQSGATTLRIASSRFYADVGLKALAEWLPAEIPTVQPVGLFVRPLTGDDVLSDPALAPLATLPDGPQTPEQLRYLVRVNISRGADHIKTWATQRAGVCEQDPQEPTYDVDQLRAIVRAAGGRPVMCHSHGAEGCQAAVEAGVTSLEHGTFVSDETLALMRRRGTFFTPTISAVVDLSEPGGEYDEACLIERGKVMLPVLRSAVQKAYRLGIPIAAGADTSYSEDSVTSAATEVQYLNEAGLSALDAVRAATTTAARLFGLERKAGRIARGYSADVLAVDGSPLDDTTTLQSPRLIVHAGAIAHNDF
jgi:imidazolonepropionase-like amidohydrolase